MQTINISPKEALNAIYEATGHLNLKRVEMIRLEQCFTVMHEFIDKAKITEDTKDAKAEEPKSTKDKK